MKIETLNSRIENAKATIAKKEATLARHQKAADKMLKNITAHGWDANDRFCRRDTDEHNDAYWAICDYQNKLDDIKRTEKAIEEATASLNRYQTALVDEESKIASRDCQVIWDFLNNWEAETVQFMLEQREIYLAEQKVFWETSKDLSHRKWKECNSIEERKQVGREIDTLHNNFHARWGFIEQFNHGSKEWEETMREDIAEEKNRKYDALIEKVNYFCGTITDASHLRVGPKGDLDGFIVGDKGKAEVHTIGAGGYNIQRFHYRVLVHPIA